MSVSPIRAGSVVRHCRHEAGAAEITDRGDSSIGSSRLRKEGIAFFYFNLRPTAAADSAEEVMMNVPPTESIRNVAVVSHAGSGKTSLVEALAYGAGSLSVLGS